MNKKFLFFSMIIFTFFFAVDGYSQTLELYGTFNAMGVIVSFNVSDDPDWDASALLEFRTGGNDFKPGFPLSRVDDDRFVGSIFWLNSGTNYDIKVTLSDPDAGPLDGIVLELSHSTRSEISVPTPVNSFYVATNGSDNPPNDGSIANPFATISRALQEVQSGDAIVLREGIYYQGDIDISLSGSETAPIIIQSFPNETAVLDGADPSTFSWTALGNGVYSTVVNVPNTHLVTANGQRLYPYQSYSDLQSLSWGIPGFYADGTTVYVHLDGDEDVNPNDAFMIVSRYNKAFEMNGAFIYCLNLTFRHFGQGSYAKAIYLNNGDDNLFDGCTFAVNDVGIGMKRDVHRNVIQNCEFYDTVFDWDWDAVKGGSGLETGGVVCYDPMTGRGNIIRRNKFHDYFDGLNCNPSSTGGLTNETDIYENLVYRCGDDGIEADGYSSNVRIYSNTFYDVLAGISLAPTYTGPTYAIRNLIYRTGVGNNIYSGLSFKFNSGYDTSGPMYLFHNTCDAFLEGNNGLYIKSPGSWSVIYSRNNIWSGTEYSISNSNPSQPVDLDYDNLYTTLENELVWWSGLTDRHLETLGEVQSVLGQELNGLNEEPQFYNSASGNYTLKASSLLIDKGLFIPNISEPYNGSAPDIGAFEYSYSSDVESWFLWK